MQARGPSAAARADLVANLSLWPFYSMAKMTLLSITIIDNFSDEIICIMRNDIFNILFCHTHRVNE